VAESPFFAGPNAVGQEPFELRGTKDAELSTLRSTLAGATTDVTALQSDLADLQSELDDTQSDLAVWQLSHALEHFTLAKAPIWVTVAAGSFAGSGTTTSTSNADYPGPVNVSINKQITNSVLLVSGTVSLWMSAAGFGEWAVRINSVDYFVAANYINVTGNHTQIYGNSFVASGLAAGTYSTRIRWRSPNGVQLNTDTNDRVFLTVTEWPL
jgi:hypothetical protein